MACDLLPIISRRKLYQSLAESTRTHVLASTRTQCHNTATPIAQRLTRNRLCHHRLRRGMASGRAQSVAPAARANEMNATQPSSRGSMEGIKLSRQSQPPCPAHPPAAHSRSGVDVSGNIVDAVEPHRIEPTMHLHGPPLDVTPHVEDQQDWRETDSVWSRISSVSRRGFTRIYEFLTRSIFWGFRV